MIHSENEYKLLEEKLKKVIKENEFKNKQIKLLNKQNKQKDEVIEDLDKGVNSKIDKFKKQYESVLMLLKDAESSSKNKDNEIKELKKKVEELKELLGIREKSLATDSSNSCKPSSTNGFKKVIQNNRVKSDKKPGRAKGHVKSSASVSKTPDEKIKVSKVATCSCGCKTEDLEEISRDEISIKIVVHTKQYTGTKTKCPCCNKVHSPKFPKNINNTINYNKNVKSLIVFLNSYCNVPNQKVTEFLSFLSNRKINICSATVGNTMKTFSKKSQKTLAKLKKQILKEPVINEDETPISVNGKLMSSIGIFTNKISLVEAFENRKLESFLNMGILDRYIGTVCHDHNNIHRSFKQFKDAECNFHILRYCKSELEIHKREEIKAFMNFMLELRDLVDEKKFFNQTSILDEEYMIYKEKYLALLTKWNISHKKDYDKCNTKYYQSERCLIKRLMQFVDDHLRFLKDFRIDFTNNLAERGLRKIKTKLKIAGGFRSLEFARYYCDAISIIDTCKKQNMDIGETIKSIFIGKKKIFAF